MMTLTTLTTWGWKAGWQYGLMGLPLAFCALPLYILLPNWYARSYGMPLATVGWVMLAARLLDALLDPFIGRWIDRLYRASATHVLKLCAFTALSMAAGFYFLFFASFSCLVSFSFLFSTLYVSGISCRRTLPQRSIAEIQRRVM